MRIPWPPKLAFKRALPDTLMIAGISRFSWKMVCFWLILAIGPVFIFFVKGGLETAMPELEDLVYSLVTVVSVLAAIFLYQLWCAPFKILRDRGDPIAMQIVPEKWKNVSAYTLDEAACLWAGAPPHSPIVNPDVRVAFYELRSSMVAGRLRYRTGVVAQTMKRAFGETVVPKGDQALTAIDLRRYADSIGTVPAFLQCVEVLIEKKPESEKDETSS